MTPVMGAQENKEDFRSKDSALTVQRAGPRCAPELRSVAGAGAKGGDALRCWNLRGKCRHRCSRKEKVYVYCTNGNMCCVKPKYQPKNKPWLL
ncbi:Beta-defensin 123 [Sciurus carolinensis]|uniref:Beta-defensin n=1 Tax=Sciurus carolinensis TaxID=30640 RepID=A0AA41N4T8_SCICA|nr:Beta-defensin 123 [Sciurus carolinensis]